MLSKIASFVVALFVLVGAANAQQTSSPVFGPTFGGNSAGGGLQPSSGITPSAGGPLTSTGTGTLQNMPRIGQLFIVGDSFARAIGVGDYALSYAGLLAKDTPAPVYNASVSATYSNQYVLQALNNFDPNPNYPSVSLISGSENDGNSGDTCGGGLGTTCMKSFTLNEQALIGWLSIPMADRMFTNNGACTRTGTWNVYAGTSDMYLPTYTWQPGPGAGFAAYGPNTNATMTCTVTTPTTVTQLGLNYAVNSSNSSFTVQADGVLQTDLCSGTTTFSTASCSTLHGNTVGMYRAKLTVSPATMHTVLITYTHNTTDTVFQSVDWTIPHQATNNVVFQYAQNQAWANYANYNTQMASIYAAAQADGLPANFVDTANGVIYNGTTYSVNGTTDVSQTATANCSGSIALNHPNTCGEEHYREALQAAEYAAVNPAGGTGFVFSSPNLVNNQAVGDNAVSNGPLMTKTPVAAIASAASIVLTNGAQFGAVHITGTTIINSMQPWPTCLQNQFTNCYLTMIFDTAGGGVNAFGVNTYPFFSSFSAPRAGTAITMMWDGLNEEWYPIQSTPQKVFTSLFVPNPSFDYANGQYQKLPNPLAVNSTATATNIQPGQTLYIQICEDATGGHTWTWSTGFSGATAISTTASLCSDYIFTSFTAGNFQQMSAVVGVAP